jgi:hypothetical protein
LSGKRTRSATAGGPRSPRMRIREQAAQHHHRCRGLAEHGQREPCPVEPRVTRLVRGVNVNLQACAMFPDQRGRERWDKERDTRDVLQGLAVALPLSLLLCGLVALVVALLG